MPVTVKQPRAAVRPGALTVVRAFDALCERGALTRGELARALDASPSTITAAVRELQSRGLVTETGTDVSTGGRRPQRLDLAPSLGSVLAADVGAINVRVAAADVRGRILERRSFPTRGRSSAARFRRELVAALAGVSETAPQPIHALTLAVAGVVDADTRQVSLATVPGWPEGDPAAWLAELGIPVLVENEANLAAVGEHAHARAAQGSLVFVAVGAGIGAGVMIRGELYRGATGSAGEIGYLRRDGASAARQLEREAAAEAAVRLYRSAGGESGVRTAEEVFARAEGGETAAERAVERLVDELSLGIANVVAVLDPDRVVLGGGLGAASGRLLDALQERIAPVVPSMPDLAVSDLGADAALVGAATWAAREAQRLLRDRLAAEIHG